MPSVAAPEPLSTFNTELPISPTPSNFSEQKSYARPDLQDEPKKKAHWAIRILAVAVGGGMIAANVMLFGNDGPGPRFRVGGLALGSVFLIAGVTGRGLTR